jgi:hypothetical protein
MAEYHVELYVSQSDPAAKVGRGAAGSGQLGGSIGQTGMAADVFSS